MKQYKSKEEHGIWWVIEHGNNKSLTIKLAICFSEVAALRICNALNAKQEGI